MRVDIAQEHHTLKFPLDPCRAIPHMSIMTQVLEEKIAHLTRTVEELSDVMAKQDSELRRLSLIVDHLAQRAKGREEDGDGVFILGDERPPHY